MFKAAFIATTVLLASATASFADTVFTVKGESNTVGDDWNGNVHVGIGKEYSTESSTFGITAGPGYFIDPDGEDEVSIKGSLYYEAALGESSSLDLELDVYYLTDSDQVNTELSAEYKMLF